jgi:hypothetical protein
MNDIYKQVIGGIVLISVGVTIALMDFNAYSYCAGALLGVVLTVWMVRYED